MPLTHARFGTDLRLLARLDEQNSRDRGRDLATVKVRRVKRPGPPAGGPTQQPATTGDLVDLACLEEVDNLQQALLLRFLTERGELAPLGHRDYGSRLGELIGEPNTETQRNRAKLYALEALAAEPRVAKVLSVEVRPRSRSSRHDSIDIDIKLRAEGSDTVLNLVFPFFLEGGSA